MEQNASLEEEYRALAHALFRESSLLMRLKPDMDVKSSMRGAPSVLRTLAMAEGPLSPGELSRKSSVSDARIANILRGLESRGLVERRTAPGDRRRVEVHITDAGRLETERRAEEIERLAIGFLERLGIDDSRELVRIIGRVNEVTQQGFRERADVCGPLGDADARSEGSACA